jgi:hypothetical protein
MRKTIGIVLLFTGTLWAQSATQPDLPAPAIGGQSPPTTVTRVYDLRNYLAHADDYPITPRPKLPASRPAPRTDSSDIGPEPVGYYQLGQSDAPGSPQAKAADLIKMIVSLVEPDSWRDAGGSTGFITVVNGKLYVTQTPESQTRVAKIIDAVTADANRTLGITVTWLLLTHDELTALRDPASPDTGAAVVRLDEQALQKEAAKTKPFARAHLLCTDGQTVHITSSAGPIKLQIQPILSSNKKDVIVDVLNVIGADNADGGQHFHTTARIPLGAEIVIGGLTAEPASQTDTAKELYLIVKVDVSN